MPYDRLADLPPAVKKLPKHGQEIYQKAFNAALIQYKDEGKAHGTAWAAVKTQYKQVDGKWISKEANMPKLSDDNKRQLLQAGLVTEYGLEVDNTIPRGVVVEEVFDNEVIYIVNGQSYRVPFTLEEDKPTFGEPEKVVRQTLYKPMESLQAAYSEVIQEAGRRDVDSPRVQQVLASCRGLLASEEPEEKEIEKVTKETKAVLKMIKEQAAVKTEDGVKFPAAAFAYVPETDKPSIWKLRLWEDLTKKVTRKQLGAAAAALSPGGFRGQKVAIPSADLPTVKRKIRAAYRKLGVEADDMPRWIKEAEARELAKSYTPLTEATFDKGRAKVVIIKPGFNSSEDRYYPEEMLKRDYKVFEGQKMYADHPTEEEDKARPERSIKDWVATLSEVKCDEAGIVTGIAEIVEPWLMQKLASLRDKDMLSDMGISINAVGTASKGTIEGKETLVIEKLVGCRSVDFVTEPGAGGIVTFYESDRNRDVDLIEISGLREKRPDLVAIIETDVRAQIAKEVRKAMENEGRITDLESQITTLTKERDDLKETAEKAEKDRAKAEAQATIKEAVDKAELPDAAKERLVERFKDAESAIGIVEAIQSEVDYIAKLSEAGKVRGFGPTQPEIEKDKEALKESFKRTHPEWTDVQLEEAVTGR